MKRSSYPLDWPPHVQRTVSGRRVSSRFRKLSFGAARDALVRAASRFGCGIVLSTNIGIRRDGLPYANQPAPDDPGVALYFTRGTKHYALACDTYRTVAENMRALQATLDALRTIERHGSAGLLEQAVSGFVELPPAKNDASPAWWTVLGFECRPQQPDAVRRRWAELAARFHPDKPDGSREAFELYLRAYKQAVAEGV